MIPSPPPGHSTIEARGMQGWKTSTPNRIVVVVVEEDGERGGVELDSEPLPVSTSKLGVVNHFCSIPTGSIRTHEESTATTVASDKPAPTSALKFAPMDILHHVWLGGKLVPTRLSMSVLNSELRLSNGTSSRSSSL